MESFKHEDLIIEAVENGDGAIRLDWKGKSNARQPIRVLKPFFGQLARQASDSSAGIEMHFEEIEHFNSSTITAIIHLIQTLRSQSTALTIVFDPKLKWQKLSFDALKVFQKPDGLLTIREA